MDCGDDDIGRDLRSIPEYDAPCLPDLRIDLLDMSVDTDLRTVGGC